MRLHVGCAMWAHAPWQGRYLPSALAPGERLRAYATWCNAVEGNTTFYATPTLDTVRGWAAQTDPDFRFILKLPKLLTHQQRLVGGDDQLRAFLTAIEPLGSRTHALWVQLPPSFGPADLDTLTGFLRRLPRDYRYCVEVRHRAFFEDSSSLETALGHAGAEWVTWTKKPRVPRRSVALTGHPVVRYIGRDDTAETVEGWQYWVDVVTGWLREGRSPTVFVHTPDNADALDLARRFHADVRAVLPGLDPLPDPLPSAPLTLF
jgi:uncharacterized protein YecE (DUF72 family)